MKKLRTKIAAKSGETLIETLAAIIIAVLVLLFLSTSIITATRINKTVEEADTSFNYPVESTDTAQSIDIVITDKNKLEVGSTKAYQYTDDTGYYKYYKGVNDND